jgi:hypothetical protein
MGATKSRVTLKALANVSPGFALKPWVPKPPEDIVRNPEEVFPGLPTRNPGLELAISVIHL